MKPRLSIIIPTRNREKYCICAIEDILSYDYSGLQLCIQDNSDSDEIESFVRNNIQDERLTYRRIEGQIPSSHNIASAIELAQGEYSILIGDDDTILPDLFDIVDYMAEHRLDSLSTGNLIFYYYWPGACTDTDEACLNIPNGIVPAFKPESFVPQCQLRNLLGHGTINYMQYHLPKLYHGIVRTDYLRILNDRTGSYCNGLSPDIYWAVALACLIPVHHEIRVPFTIAGACRTSASSAKSPSSQIGPLSIAPHLQLLKDYEWDRDVPRFYSHFTIWADSALKALSDMGMDCLRPEFDYEYFVAHTLYRNRSHFAYIAEQSAALKSGLARRMLFWGKSSCYFTGIVMKRIGTKLKNRLVGKQEKASYTLQQNDIRFASRFIQQKYPFTAKDGLGLHSTSTVQE